VFGKDVRIQGHVRLRNDSAVPEKIPDGAILRGDFG
jgi:hypothetical protein